MAKLLAIMAIASAVVAALAALVLVDAGAFLAVAVALAAGVVLVLQKRMETRIGGAIVILLAILGTLGTVGSVTTKGGGGGSLGIPLDWGSALLTVSLVLVPAFAAWHARASIPSWAYMVGIGAAVVAAVLACVNHAELVNQNNMLTLVVGLLCLMAVIPGVMMLMRPALDPAAPVPHEHHAPPAAKAAATPAAKAPAAKAKKAKAKK